MSPMPFRRVRLVIIMLLSAVVLQACPNPATLGQDLINWHGELVSASHVEPHRPWQSIAKVSEGDEVVIQVTGGNWSVSGGQAGA